MLHSDANLKSLSLTTKLTIAGRKPQDQYGFVNTPVYHGSTVLFPNTASLESHDRPYTYGRRGSPTSDALRDALLEIEGGAGVVLTPSGLSAISTALLSCLKAGDHLLMVDTVYAPTRHLCEGLLQGLGIETTYYDPLIGADIEKLFRPNTRVVFTESPGSLTLEIQDIPAIADVAHRHNATVLMDNTWATPLFFDAHAHGVDISLQAGTKYLCGHSDVLIGTISANAALWPALQKTHGALGLCVAPDDIYLTLRGMRTMALRLKQQQAAALDLARWMQARPEVASVRYPALENDPGHALWKRDFTGACGLFSVELKPVPQQAVHVFLDALKLFGLGFSWGGFESLALPFDASSIRTATSWSPAGPTIRFHIGLEDPEDLRADLDNAFIQMRKALGG